MAEQTNGHERPRCLAVFDTEDGVQNSRQLMAGLSLMLGDVTAKRMTTNMANTSCNIAGKMLYAAKLEQQFGESDDMGGRNLRLVRNAKALGESAQSAQPAQPATTSVSPAD